MRECGEGIMGYVNLHIQTLWFRTHLVTFNRGDFFKCCLELLRIFTNFDQIFVSVQLKVKLYCHDAMRCDFRIIDFSLVAHATMRCNLTVHTEHCNSLTIIFIRPSFDVLLCMLYIVKF